MPTALICPTPPHYPTPQRYEHLLPYYGLLPVDRYPLFCPQESNWWIMPSSLTPCGRALLKNIKTCRVISRWRNSIHGTAEVLQQWHEWHSVPLGPADQRPLCQRKERLRGRSVPRTERGLMGLLPTYTQPARPPFLEESSATAGAARAGNEFPSTFYVLIFCTGGIHTSLSTKAQPPQSFMLLSTDFHYHKVAKLELFDAGLIFILLGLSPPEPRGPSGPI